MMPAAIIAVVFLVFIGVDGQSTTTTAFVQDVFCGELRVYKQQWFDKNITVISSQITVDVKQCLEVCCNLLNCKAVTFMGVLENQTGQPNCMLLDCRDGSCSLLEKRVQDTGVVSIELLRQGTALNNNVYDVTVTVPSRLSQTNQTNSFEVLAAAVAPVWAFGLAIALAVVCTGLNLGMLTAYLCYRRQERNKSSANLSTVARNTETLHAYANAGGEL